MEKPVNYFEGILQLRKCDIEIVEFVRDEIIGDSRVHVAKEEKVKGGLDLYLSSNRFLRKLGKKLYGKFSGEFKESASLHTKKDGKELYRVTVMFRMASFKKGDIVKYKGEEWEVLNVGNRVKMRNIVSRKKKDFKFCDISV